MDHHLTQFGHQGTSDGAARSLLTGTLAVDPEPKRQKSHAASVGRKRIDPPFVADEHLEGRCRALQSDSGFHARSARTVVADLSWIDANQFPVPAGEHGDPRADRSPQADADVIRPL